MNIEMESLTIHKGSICTDIENPVIVPLLIDNRVYWANNTIYIRLLPISSISPISAQEPDNPPGFIKLLCSNEMSSAFLCGNRAGFQGQNHFLRNPGTSFEISLGKIQFCANISALVAELIAR